MSTTTVNAIRALRAALKDACAGCYRQPIRNVSGATWEVFGFHTDADVDAAVAALTKAGHTVTVAHKGSARRGPYVRVQVSTTAS